MKQDFEDFSKPVAVRTARFSIGYLFLAGAIILVISFFSILIYRFSTATSTISEPTRKIEVITPLDNTTPLYNTAPDILKPTPMDPVNPDRSNGGPLSTMPGTSIAPGPSTTPVPVVEAK